MISSLLIKSLKKNGFLKTVYLLTYNTKINIGPTTVQ